MPVTSKVGYLLPIVLTLIPIVSWLRYYLARKKLKRRYEQDKLFWKRHNCVVVYNKKRGISGWPPYETEIKLDLKNLSVFLEPLLHFLNTARQSLDIAVMIIKCKRVTDAIYEATKRGVRVRIILDYNYMKCDNEIEKLDRNGAMILYHVSESASADSIMHCKFAVKDYFNGKGFLTHGSMNWTLTALTDNYDNLVFTSKNIQVGTFKRNFETMWQYFEKEKENNLIKIALHEHF